MTKLLSFTESGFQYAWDSTSLSSFITCPRKYLYSILQGWQAEHKSVHLEFGGHYATALEHFHKHRAAGMAYDDAVREVVRETLVATWTHDFEEVSEDEGTGLATTKGELRRVPGTGAPVDWMHNTKTRDTLIRSIVWYLDQFENDPMQTVILSDGRAAVEYSFSFELSEEFLYCGHIDRLVTYGADNDIYVQDQKTSGSTVTPRFFDAYSPDIQMTGYTLAGQIIFGLPVKGVVVDAAQIAVGFTRFERGFVNRNERMLEEFRGEMLHYIGRAKQCHEENYYPMNRTACGNYGGCEFRKVCPMSPAVRSNMLEGSFVKRKRWDPLERR